MQEQDFARLVGLYDRFANALNFDSEDARAAEGEFYMLLGSLYEQERATHPTVEYPAFRRGIILRCKQRISKGG
jgi:hypothetical protein